MRLISIPKQEYSKLKEKASLNERLLIKLIKGLENIKEGKIKPWKKTIID